jgi:hypothetical protein
MTIYKPTWLYIKQHNQTGLKYFGKTTRVDPEKYLGSGKYWKLHLAKHGKDISTIWLQLFTDKDALTEYARQFSIVNNIVESSEWANLIPEDGVSSTGQRGPKNGSYGKPAWNRGLSSVPWNKGVTGVQVPWNKGITGAQEAWNKGKTLTEEQKKNMGARDGRNKGNLACGWNRGKTEPLEAKQARIAKIKEALAKKKAAKQAASLPI